MAAPGRPTPDFADVGNGQTVTNATPFAVASISKTFLAALVVKLSEEGRFGLDDPVLPYLPSSKVNPAVTIRELLDHTSGVYDFFLNSKIDKALLGCRTCTWTPSQSLSYVGKPYFAPGTAFAYSNTNYVLLGQLVEAVTGQPYAALLRQRFFDPLGLTSTYVQGMEANRGGAVAHSYRFYTRSLKEKPRSLWDGTGIVPFRSLVTAAGSAGAIASSSLDLARWARALYSGQVLGPVGMAQMLDFTGDPLNWAPAAVWPWRGALHDQRPRRGGSRRAAPRGSSRDPLPADRGNRRGRGDEHRPGRPGAHHRVASGPGPAGASADVARRAVAHRADPQPGPVGVAVHLRHRFVTPDKLSHARARDQSRYCERETSPSTSMRSRVSSVASGHVSNSRTAWPPTWLVAGTGMVPAATSCRRGTRTNWIHWLNAIVLSPKAPPASMVSRGNCSACHAPRERSSASISSAMRSNGARSATPTS